MKLSKRIMEMQKEATNEVLMDYEMAKHICEHNAEREKKNELINALKQMCSVAGFKIENEIILKNVDSGRVWKSIEMK